MVRHAFVNPKADGGDATIARPSDWNADHVVESLGDWTDYTPTVIGATTNPVIATRLGRYKKLDDNTFAIVISINYATGDTAGSGTWSIGLPAGMTTGNRDQHIAGQIHDAGTRRYVANGYLVQSGAFITNILHTETGNNGTVNPTSPITWANGDQIMLSGVIQATM